ncbi:MAG TPA: PspC domain-containing protein, partial [Micrococcaceae bacterium]
MAPPLTRSPDRIIAGVCAGLAEHLNVGVGLVRAVTVGASFFFGAGLVFYAWLWILVPVAGEATGRPDRSDDGGPVHAGPGRGLPDRGGSSWRRPSDSGLTVPDGATWQRPAQPLPGLAAPRGARYPGAAGSPRSARRRAAVGAREILLGTGLVIAAALLLAQQSGVNLPLGTLIPLGVIAAGAVLAWMQLDETRRAGLMNVARADKPFGVLRLVAGLVLVVAGVLIVVAGGGSWDLVWPSILASLAVLAGVALVLAPWGLKFWRDLQAERAGRIRETERAEIAAHLHDSVLQTLALIQKRAGSQSDVLRLARAQERELREWIYQDATRNPDNLVATIKGIAAELEDTYGLPVDVVAVGDALMTERVQALVQASKEAMLNAVRHAGTAVSVYLEATADKADIFIKDRGPGFDPAVIPADRLGVRASVIGRMQRHGGTAVILSDADGTEVRLSLPGERSASDRTEPGR